MPSFQQLLKGAAQRIAKRQAELDELRDPATIEAERLAAERAALEAQAQSHFADKWPEGQGLRLLHGSPFKFDRFDFENNLRRGEGALAFGPGGYMTGSEGLAREYARNLYRKHAGSAALEAHIPLKTAIGKNPLEMAEFLRARNVAKGLRLGFAERPYGTGLAQTSNLPSHLRGKGLQAQGVAETWSGGAPSYTFKVQTTAEDFAPYREAMRESGLGPVAIGQLGESARVGRGGLTPDQAVRIGGNLRNVIEKNYGGSSLRPRISDRYSLMPQSEYDEILNYQEAQKGRALGDIRTWAPALPPGRNYWSGPAGLRGADAALRQNLNSSWRAVNQRPGNQRVKVSMAPSSSGGGYVDFNKVDLYKALAEGRITPSEFARRLYAAELQAHPNELLPYDYPMNVAGPNVVGALAQLQRALPGLGVDPSKTGSDLIREVQRRASEAKMSAADQMRLLREAGIPAMYFERAGHRRGQLPDRFDPERYNFVIFDQDRLGVPDVEEFGHGGHVT